jgi:hypothetical protein
MLSLPLSRAVHYLGRLGGFAVCAVLVAVAFALALIPWARADSLILWAVSLAVECALVAAVALFISMSLGQLVGAISATAALYLLGRSIAAIQAIAAGPLADASLAGTLARRIVDALAFLLPRLDAVTRTEWLLYGGPSGAEYARAIGALAVYALLVSAAGLFDFYRRSP